MKQIGFGILKKSLFIKFLCLFLVSAFSVDGFACEGVDMDAVGDAYIAAAPDDPVRNYTEGYARYCQGRGGLDYIGKASDLGHVAASYFLGDYYRTDGDIKSNRLSTNQDNYDAAVFYYNRAATQIENMTAYPRRPDGKGVHEKEGTHYMSVRVFLYLNSLYYNGYSRALGDMLKNDVSYTDTIQVLTNMQNAADRCLQRPSLAIWGARQDEIANSKQVICQAQKDFAETAIDLESQRIEIAKRCDVALSECTEHQAIFQEIVQASRRMYNTVQSVSKI